ncbi:hypothetical protein LTS17_001877 [Exophiala oligosperma]
MDTQASDDKITDAALIGEKVGISHEEAMHWGELTEEELHIEKKLRLKIDMLVMPLVILVYLMNYIDRNNYAAARLQGLEQDLHLTGDQYQVGLSILFVAYVLMQVPSNALLNYSGRPSWYLGFFVCAWGLVSALTSQKWYTKGELSLRMAIFYSGSLISGAFGNLIAAGILSGLAGARGMSAWQWLYVIEGAITCFIGVVIIFVLPDFPDTWRALSPEMKRVANRRLAIDAAEADVDEAGGMSQIRGMKLAFMDPKTYILAIAYHGITGAAGFQNFFPTLTATLGYSHIVSLLLVAPPYVFLVFYSFFHSWLSDRVGNRFWFFMYPIPITIVGCVIFMTTDSFGPRYFSLFLMNFVFAMNATCYAWISNAIPRPPAKRAAALAFMNSVGNAASIWTPFTYYDSQGKHYPVALGVVIGLLVVGGLSGIALRYVLEKENKQLARLEDDNIQLSERELARLRKTAEIEGIDIAAARRLQKGYRFMI